MMTPSMPGTFLRIASIIPPNSSGVVYPTVSGMLRVVAPARMRDVEHLVRNAGSLRPASSG